MPDKKQSVLIDSAELALFMGVAPGTIKRWSRNGDMPKGRRVGPRLLKWDRTEIQTWMDAGCPRVDELTHQEKAFH